MKQITKFPGANGVLPLALGWRGAFFNIDLHGGPFAKFAFGDNGFGICLREVEPVDYDVWLPIEDFGIPNNDDDVREAMVEAFEAALCGEDVYIGCMGGFGRTGLFLSLMTKAAGYPDPVGYVRKKYTSLAVETGEQKRYVAQFDVASVRRKLRRIAWRTRFSRLRLGLAAAMHSYRASSSPA